MTISKAGPVRISGGSNPEEKKKVHPSRHDKKMTYSERTSKEEIFVP